MIIEVMDIPEIGYLIPHPKRFSHWNVIFYSNNGKKFLILLDQIDQGKYEKFSRKEFFELYTSKFS